MAEERTFARNGNVVTTRTPSAVTDLLARGYHEVFPTEERPEPDSRKPYGYVGSTGESTGPQLHAESPSRRRRAKSDVDTAEDSTESE